MTGKKTVGSVPVSWGVDKAISFFKEKLYFETFALISTDNTKVFEVHSGVGKTGLQVIVTKTRFKLVR